MDNLEIIAYHGWGFDRHCWQGWTQLPGLEYQEFHLYDRGYFGEANDPVFQDEDSFKIIFAHSFGLHLCNEDVFSQCDLLVVFNGFLNFHPFAVQFKRRSKMVVRKMIERFREHPGEVLEEFYQNVYYPSPPGQDVPGPLDEELLLNDLKALESETLDPEPLKRAGKICILHGAKDAIVPKIKGRQIYDLLSEHGSYFEVSDAGHALPFTHLDQCWSFVKAEIE